MEIRPFGQNVSELAKTSEKKGGVQGQTVSEMAQNKKAQSNDEPSNKAVLKQQLNKQIMQASVNVSLNSNDKAMQVLFNEAIDGINAELEGTLGPNAIQTAYESGLDVSPEATADRIVSLSTAFFSAYQEQNSDLSYDEQVTQFTEIISGGIAKGFDEARDILEGLNVLKGDIATNIDKTFELVQAGLDDFKERIRASSIDNATSLSGDDNA